jgi:hypothetical protein
LAETGWAHSARAGLQIRRPVQSTVAVGLASLHTVYLFQRASPETAKLIGPAQLWKAVPVKLPATLSIVLMTFWWVLAVNQLKASWVIAVGPKAFSGTQLL